MRGYVSSIDETQFVTRGTWLKYTVVKNIDVSNYRIILLSYIVLSHEG